VIFVLGVIPTKASTTQSKIDNARAARNRTQSNLAETKNRIDNLQSKKGESEEYLSELSIQLEDLRNSLIQLQADEEKKQNELEKVQGELEEARVQEEKQYEDMKLRIQFMYEKSSADYLVMLLSASDFTDFLNRADNISQISEYDREMLKNYQDTKDIIKEKEDAVKQEQHEIAVLKEEISGKQTEVELVMTSTAEQISIYKSDIANAESEELSLLARISNQEDEINGLIRQAKAEEAAEQARLAEQARAEAQAQAISSANSSSSSSASRSNSSASSVSPSSSNQAAPSSSTPTSAPEREDLVSNEVDNTSSQGTYLGKFRLTAYCSCVRCCGKWAGGPTASGVMPTAGRTIAMGGVPFGTKLRINGTVYTVEDRGTSYGHVDVYFGSHAEALGFGSKYADVYQVN